MFVSGINTATQISTGSVHACALLSNGQVWCWGRGTLGELGDGLDATSSSPVQVSLPTNTATMIDGNYRDTIAIMADGTAYGWGENRGSKLRCSTDTTNVLSPIPFDFLHLSGLSNIIDIAVTQRYLIYHQSTFLKIQMVMGGELSTVAVVSIKTIT